MRIELLFLSRNLVGNSAEVRAEILEDMGAYWRVKDTIRMEIEGGARMTDDQIVAHIGEAYNG